MMIEERTRECVKKREGKREQEIDMILNAIYVGTIIAFLYAPLFT